MTESMRCQRLNKFGRRCRGKAVGFVTWYQGYEWGVVAVCLKHRYPSMYPLNEKTDFPVRGEGIEKK